MQQSVNCVTKKLNHNIKRLNFHSDQGWQYQHAYYRNKLSEHGIIQTMSRKGNCYDNCIMETFFGRMKNKMDATCIIQDNIHVFSLV